jgi:predicted tellurium resistance membrane protein TerC
MDGWIYLWALFFVLLISSVVVLCVVGLKMLREKQDLKQKNKQKGMQNNKQFNKQNNKQNNKQKNKQNK